MYVELEEFGSEEFGSLDLKFDDLEEVNVLDEFFEGYINEERKHYRYALVKRVDGKDIGNTMLDEPDTKKENIKVN